MANENNTIQKICIIGAGVGGICAGIQLKRLLKIDNFTIFEKNEDVGGVWYTNRYPGCANDNPSICYTYSFAPKADFPTTFATSKETCDYLKDAAIEHNIYQRIRFGTEVQSLKWNEGSKKWKVTILDKQNNSEETQYYDIMICATGHFRIPKYPKEFLDFQGPTVHTAEWNDEVDLENKIVAVIGSGASAIQLIPSIVNKVKLLHSYQRDVYWTFFLRPNFNTPKIVQWTFAYVPLVLLMTKLLFLFLFELIWTFFRTDWNLGEKFQNFSLRVMKWKIPNNDKLVQDLTPTFKVGCKRINMSNEYFHAISHSNVQLHKERITKVTHDSIITEDNNEIKIDILVLATGFDVGSYFAPMEIIGRNGRNILKEWQNSSPSTYYSIVSSCMPNLFTLHGPHSDLGHNAATAMIELQVKFMIRILEEMSKRNSRCIVVKESSEKEFMQDMKKWLSRMIQDSDECVSYYRNSRKVTTMLWPLTLIHYWFKTKFIKFSKFEFS